MTHPELTTLQVAMEGETDIVTRRDFGHPPARVWRGLTEPALIRQWMAVEGHPMSRCEIDPRPGGAFHYEWAGPDGSSFFFSGPVEVAEPPHRMVHVEHFNGDPALACEVTTDLAPREDGTRMTLRMRYADAQAREAAIATGMTDGMDAVYRRLDTLLAA